MRNKIKTKEDILHSAEELIRKEGLKACSMRRLAARCGTAVGTIYNYFPSHKALLEDLFIISWSNTAEKLSMIPVLPAKEHLIQFIDILASEISARDGLGIILYGDRISSDYLNNNEQSVFSQIYPIIISILEKSDTYRGIPKMQVALNAEWILLILMDHFIRKDRDIEFLKEQLILRFL